MELGGDEHSRLTGASVSGVLHATGWVALSKRRLVILKFIRVSTKSSTSFFYLFTYLFILFEKQKPRFFCSLLALEGLLDDILGLRLFAIVLNHHTTATSHFTGFSLPVNSLEAQPVALFLAVLTLLWLLWGSGPPPT